MEIRYEDLCEVSLEWVCVAIEFAGLEWSPGFAATVRNFVLKNTNYKWQEELTGAQQKVFNECLSDTLKKYGHV